MLSLMTSSYHTTNISVYVQYVSELELKYEADNNNSLVHSSSTINLHAASRILLIWRLCCSNNFSNRSSAVFSSILDEQMYVSVRLCTSLYVSVRLCTSLDVFRLCTPDRVILLVGQIDLTWTYCLHEYRTGLAADLSLGSLFRS